MLVSAYDALRSLIGFALLVFCYHAQADEQPTLANWQEQCDSEYCAYFYDVVHQAGADVKMVTIAIQFRLSDGQLDKASLFFPGVATPSSGAYMAFVASELTADGYRLHKLDDSTMPLQIAYCVEDGCEAELSQLPENYPLFHRVLHASHLWLSYQLDGESIRVLASMRGLQEYCESADKTPSPWCPKD